jgi:hypothetical protein
MVSDWLVAWLYISFRIRTYPTQLKSHVVCWFRCILFKRFIATFLEDLLRGFPHDYVSFARAYKML